MDNKNESFVIMTNVQLAYKILFKIAIYKDVLEFIKKYVGKNHVFINWKQKTLTC